MARPKKGTTTTKVDGHSHKIVLGEKFTSVDAGHRHSLRIVEGRVTVVLKNRDHVHLVK